MTAQLAPLPRPARRGFVLHVLDDLAAAWHTDRIADAAAQHYVYDEAPQWVSRRHWQEAACVLVEADTVAELLALELPRRRGVLIIAHDLDDSSIYDGALALGAERVTVLPDESHIVAETIVQRLYSFAA